MSTSKEQKYISELETRVNDLVKEKARLTLLAEMLKNFESTLELHEILNTILQDIQMLHSVQNAIIIYNINNVWKKCDIYGEESIIEINNDNLLEQSIIEKKNN